MQRIIKKVIMNKANGQKVITVPKHCHLMEGDHVELIKVPKPFKNSKGEYVWPRK